MVLSGCFSCLGVFLDGFLLFCFNGFFWGFLVLCSFLVCFLDLFSQFFFSILFPWFCFLGFFLFPGFTTALQAASWGFTPHPSYY